MGQADRKEFHTSGRNHALNPRPNCMKKTLRITIAALCVALYAGLCWLVLRRA